MYISQKPHLAKATLVVCFLATHVAKMCDQHTCSNAVKTLSTGALAYYHQTCFLSLVGEF